MALALRFIQMKCGNGEMRRPGAEGIDAFKIIQIRSSQALGKYAKYSAPELFAADSIADKQCCRVFQRK